MLASAMLDWFADHKALTATLVTASVVMFIGGALLVPVLVVRMPADFFTRKERPPESWSGQHPALRALLRVLKNFLGGVLVLLGVALLLMPGQGVLTILIGIGLLDFPGKRRLEVWLVRLPGVLKAINWLRERRHRPPLEIPERQGRGQRALDEDS